MAGCAEGGLMKQAVIVHNRTRATVIAEQAELATSWWARLRGLIGRKALPAGHGLIIRPCSSIHTFFMSFPIDVIFADAQDRVLSVTPAVGVGRIGPLAPGAKYVIELPVGAIAASGTEPGDTLEWTPCGQA